MLYVVSGVCSMHSIRCDTRGIFCMHTYKAYSMQATQHAKPNGPGNPIEHELKRSSVST